MKKIISLAVLFFAAKKLYSMFGQGGSNSRSVHSGSGGTDMTGRNYNTSLSEEFGGSVRGGIVSGEVGSGFAGASSSAGTQAGSMNIGDEGSDMDIRPKTGEGTSTAGGTGFNSSTPGTDLRGEVL